MNGTEVPLGSNRYTLVAGTLVISNPESVRDAGSYQCLAINRCGTIISRAANLKFGCESFTFFVVLMACVFLHLQLAMITFLILYLSLFPQTSMTSLQIAEVHRQYMRELALSWPVSPPHITQVPLLLQSNLIQVIKCNLFILDHSFRNRSACNPQNNSQQTLSCC